MIYLSLLMIAAEIIFIYLDVKKKRKVENKKDNIQAEVLIKKSNKIFSGSKRDKTKSTPKQNKLNNPFFKHGKRGRYGLSHTNI